MSILSVYLAQLSESDFKPESDIDIIVDFSQPIGIEFIDLADDLRENCSAEKWMLYPKQV